MPIIACQIGNRDKSGFDQNGNRRLSGKRFTLNFFIKNFREHKSSNLNNPEVKGHLMKSLVVEHGVFGLKTNNVITLIH